MDRIVAEWTATWDCPKCMELTSSCDDGVEDQNEYFDVTCQECEHEYKVYKD